MLQSLDQDLFSRIDDAIRAVLNLDDREIVPATTLVGNLGAESIDFLDISCEIEKHFNIEVDFMGNQPAVTEASFVNNGTFRLRAATAKLETDYVDVLAGQSYFLFGHGPFFFPMSIWFFGMPNQVFGRTQQFRVSHTFKGDAVILRPTRRIRAFHCVSR